MDESLPPEPADKEYAGDRPEPFQARRQSRSLLRFVPIVGDLRSYSRRLLRADLVAGVALAAVAIYLVALMAHPLVAGVSALG